MGVAPFRSPLLRGSRLIPLPPGTEMFPFPGFAPRLAVTGVPAGRVSPFGHPGLIARVQLPPAYRGLPRPSSPPCAQASPTGPLSLDPLSSHTPAMRRAVKLCEAVGVTRPGTHAPGPSPPRRRIHLTHYHIVCQTAVGIQSIPPSRLVVPLARNHEQSRTGLRCAGRATPSEAFRRRGRPPRVLGAPVRR